MRPHLTLTHRYILFLTGVIAMLIIGSLVITTSVLRDALLDVFGQRFARVNEVLHQYLVAEHVQTVKNLEVILSSPRFLAAVETADSATLTAEARAYQSIVKADIFSLLDAGGRTVYVSAGVGRAEAADLQALMALSGTETKVHYRVFGTDLIQLACAPVVNNNGQVSGWVAAGSAVTDRMVHDLGRLSGFDIVLARNEQILSTNLPAGSTIGQHIPRSILTLGSRMTEIDWSGNKMVAASINDIPSGLHFTFVANLEEHLAGIRAQATFYLFLLAVVGGLLAVGVIYFFTSRQIGKQVTALVAAADNISRGNLDFRVESLSKDELGYLAVAMERMRLDIVRNQKDLQKAHHDMLSAERMVTVGKLTAGIIHDFKNPMTVIRGNSELVEKAGRENERIVKYCTSIRAQVDRMVEMTRDVLEFSRGTTTIELGQVELQAYFADIAAFHLAAFEQSGVTLAIRGSGPSWVRLDAVRFRRVIDNIVTNAREVLRPGGEVSLAWRTTDKGCLISVSDNGPGIPSEIKETLFEPFVTSQKEGGTGLGLAIAKKIIDDHGAGIAVNSSSLGTTFEILLPVSLVLNTTARQEEVLAT